MGQRRESWTKGQFSTAIRGAKQLAQDTWWTPNSGGLYIKVVGSSNGGIQVLLTPGACSC